LRKNSRLTDIRHTRLLQLVESSMEDPTNMSLELLYVADPMCSWCWGFAPVIDKIDHSVDIPVRVVVGGLRPGERAEPLDGVRAMLEHHWQQVAAASGQPFDFGALDRTGWMYDTLVPDTAVVTMRSIAPSETLRFLAAVQRAFYAEAIDVTDPGVYLDLVAGFPVDPNAFVEAVLSPAMLASAEQDFREAQWIGATGFPTLLLRDGASAVPLSVGYAPYETVASRLSGLIERTYPDLAETVLCDIDGGAC
jgi:putative protein-disulfide isomerase